MTKQSKTTGATKTKRPATKRPVSSLRKLAPASYEKFVPRSFRASRTKPKYHTLPKARLMFGEAIQLLWSGRRVTAGITGVYALGLLLLVVGFSLGADFTKVREALQTEAQTASGVNSLALQIVYLFGNTSSTPSPVSGLYQSILLVVCSLALIWALRELRQKRAVTVKQSFYRGMTPLVPFLLVVLVIGLQFLPMTIGAYVYGIVTDYGIAVRGYEKLLALLLLVLGALWSFRMLTSSFFAPYAVTLPNMEPQRALREVRAVVEGRRLLVWRKILFLPLALIITIVLAISPFIVVAPVLAPWAFFLLSCGAFAVTHAFMFVLYRELIRE